MRNEECRREIRTEMTAYFNLKAKAIERSREVCREQNADNARGQFLRSLRTANIALTHFEAEFLASFLEHNLKAEAGLDFKWFSPGRRAVVDRMMKRYCARLPLPNAERGIRNSESGNSALRNQPRLRVGGPHSELGSTCDFFVRDDGRQQRCGEPATHCSANQRLVYCTPHAEHVARGAWINGKLVKPAVIPLPNAERGTRNEESGNSALRTPHSELLSPRPDSAPVRPDTAGAKFSQLRSAAGLAALLLF
jgi:hypothetical protein